jgi:hypothetical protein
MPILMKVFLFLITLLLPTANPGIFQEPENELEGKGFDVNVRVIAAHDYGIGRLSAMELNPAFLTLFEQGSRILLPGPLLRKDPANSTPFPHSVVRDGMETFHFTNPGWFVIFPDCHDDEFYEEPEFYEPMAAIVGEVFYFDGKKNQEVEFKLQPSSMVKIELPGDQDQLKGQAMLVSTCANPRGQWFQFSEIQDGFVTFKGLPEGKHSVQIHFPRENDQFSRSFLSIEVKGGKSAVVSLPIEARIPTTPMPKGRRALRDPFVTLNQCLDLTGKAPPPIMQRWVREDWLEDGVPHYKLIDLAAPKVEHEFVGATIKLFADPNLFPYSIDIWDEQGRPHTWLRTFGGGEGTMVLAEGKYIAELRDTYGAEKLASKTIVIGPETTAQELRLAWGEDWQVKAK